MKSFYDTEFNRTLPEQTEGPEFTDYLNPMGKRKKRKYAAAAAAVTAAAVTAAALLGLFSGALKLLAVGIDRASVSCSISGEIDDTAFTYVLYDGEVPVKSGTAGGGETVLEFTELEPDTPYLLVLYSGGAEADSLSFKTLPGTVLKPEPPVPGPVPVPPGPVPVPPAPVPDPDPLIIEPDPGPEPWTDPEPEPEPEPEPAPELRDMTFDSLNAGQLSSAPFIALEPSYTLNDSVITGHELLMNGDLCSYTEESDGTFTVDASGFEGETVTLRLTYFFTTGDRSGSVYKEAEHTVAQSYVSPVLLNDGIFTTDLTAYPEMFIENSGNTPVSASLQIGSDTFSLSRSAANSGDDISVFEYPSGIDLTGYVDMGDLPGPDEYFALPSTFSITFIDAVGTERTESHSVDTVISPAPGAYAEHSTGETGFSVISYQMPADAGMLSLDIYVSDSDMTRGEKPLITVDSPVFTSVSEYAAQYIYDFGADFASVEGKWIHAVLTVKAFDRTVSIVMYPVLAD